MDINDFNFSYPVQMRWNDLDPLGHVNNALYVTYFEIARGRFMIAACPKWDWTKDMFLIGNVTVNFHKEMLLTSVNPRVYVRTSKLGNKSFVIEYVVVSDKNNEVIVHATGSSTQVMFDMKTKTTIELPDWVRNSLSEYDHSN